MWALASILLEILSGFPLWLSLKSRVIAREGRSIINFGMFGVAGRDNAKILAKQQQLLKGGLPSLINTLTKQFDVTKGNKWLCDGLFCNLFSQMLCFNPEHRISPEEILEHDFMKEFVPHFLKRQQQQI
jgi:dual specificity tyrosine-phosphorylation-regulated kinase 2/3/4